ncbi:MAG: alpha/beta fold hydrolase, partial [Actinomycetota bacterium]|nr:alpha/beta fold hydrolase [Actinomycetota bacterium]
LESVQLRWADAVIRETPLRIELAGKELFGIVTEPVHVDAGAICAVLLNGGALRHTGPNRSWVEIARRWAARGVPTVRFDLQGIGDSEGDEQSLVSNPALYAPASTEQTLAILDQLARSELPDRFVLAGLCSGAYWALHCALRDTRVAAALMINLYSFYWSEALVAERETSRALAALRGRGWRRMLRRDVSLKELTGIVQSVRPSRLRSGAQLPVELAQKEQVEQALDLLRERGTQALMLFSHDEALYDQLIRQGLIDKLDRWPNLQIERIPSRDHMFRALWLQRQVHDSVDRALDRVLAALPATPKPPR